MNSQRRTEKHFKLQSSEVKVNGDAQESLIELYQADEQSLELGAHKSTRTDQTSFEVIIERDLDKRIFSLTKGH